MSSSSKGNQTSIQRPAPSNTFDDKPLWNHVKLLHVPVGGGGNRQWSCNYCNKIVTGSYSKVKAHLLKLPNCGVTCCKAMEEEVRAIIVKEHEHSELQKAKQQTSSRSQKEYLTLPEETDLVQHKKRKGTPTSPLEKAFNVKQRDTIDKLAARMFYASALPFNLVRCPYFQKFSGELADSKVSGYVPPSYNRLRTTLLAQEKTRINRKLQPNRDTWKKKRVSICSNGWTNIQRRPLINIMAASAGGAIFITAINSSENVKDAEYVASLFLKAIEEIGVTNVVQIVTDNAANFEAAGVIIEKKYPHIFWTPCVVHSLNLALKRLCEPPENSDHYAQCCWIGELIHDIQNIRNFILNHDMANAIFKSYSSLSLLKIAETRFASAIIMAQRVKDVKETLEKMVMDPSWRIYKGDGKSTIEMKARDVKKCIVDDSWWDKLDYLLKFTEPIIRMLRAADTDSPILHEIYDMWDCMIENVKEIIFQHEGKDLLIDNSEFFYAIHTILESRWNKSNTPLHCMAHSLVPKYYSNAWLQGGSNGIQRLSPHEDPEVSTNRTSCFQRLFADPNKFKEVSKEYGAFSSGTGPLVLLMLLMQGIMKKHFLGGLIMDPQPHYCKL